MNKGNNYALLAALLNSTVGILSLSVGMLPDHLAFYRCVAALSMLSFMILISAERRDAWRAILPQTPQIAFLALFGVFFLYYFEITAFQYSHIATVTFCVLGSATMTTFVGSYIFLNKKLDLKSVCSLIFALCGLITFYSGNQIFLASTVGLFCAVVAGIGYGSFLVLTKKFTVSLASYEGLWWLMFFGGLYLLIPLMNQHLIIPSPSSWIKIIAMGLLPTIGGFYCTTKALCYADANQVQLCELSEPVFAALLAIVFFNQWLNLYDVCGGVLVILSILIFNRQERRHKGGGYFKMAVIKKV